MSIDSGPPPHVTSASDVGWRCDVSRGRDVDPTIFKFFQPNIIFKISVTWRDIITGSDVRTGRDVSQGRDVNSTANCQLPTANCQLPTASRPSGPHHNFLNSPLEFPAVVTSKRRKHTDTQTHTHTDRPSYTAKPTSRHVTSSF